MNCQHAHGTSRRASRSSCKWRALAGVALLAGACHGAQPTKPTASDSPSRVTPPAPDVTPPTPRPTPEQPAPSDDKTLFGYLEGLHPDPSWKHTPSGHLVRGMPFFDADKVPALDVEKIVGFVAPSGLRIVLPDSSRQFSREELLSSLRDREGDAFLSLTHLGHRLKDPRCEVNVKIEQKREVISVCGAYEAHMQKIEGAFLLTELRYLIIEDL